MLCVCKFTFLRSYLKSKGLVKDLLNVFIFQAERLLQDVLYLSEIISLDSCSVCWPYFRLGHHDW